MIRVGVGGWTFAPWRNSFYPKGLKHAGELRYAATKLTAIEINGTFYSAQSPASFARWRDETPEGFVFTVKGHRAVVSPRDLAGARGAIGWFLDTGVTELREKLGPLLWQFAPTRKFDAGNIGAFLSLLPREKNGLRLRHALEVRSKTFLVPEFVDLARRHEVAIVLAHSDKYPMIADVTADFVYARLLKSREHFRAGYRPMDLDRWAWTMRTWEAGGQPGDLPRYGRMAAPEQRRDVFAFVISGAKVRAPHAATALIQRLQAEAHR
jgi:uncharacterized protein YecE (DUF72 family)